jgi:hypothetical protein
MNLSTAATLECGGKRSATPLWLAGPADAAKPKPRRRFVVPAHSMLAAWLAVALAPAMASETATSTVTNSTSVIVVVGAAGEEEFGLTFAESAARWVKACGEAGAKLTSIGVGINPAQSDYERLQQALAGEPKDGAAELWLVLLGHGTFNGKEAKFNLRGADVSATELAEWLKPFHRPLAVLNTSSASAPFLAKLSGTNRVIITATRSGNEVNYARLGRFISEAIADPEADMDKDCQTSLLEAFLTACRRTAEFYSSEGRLATEHAMIDDNGDGLGTQADWFRGIRAVKRAKAGAMPDGLRAHQFHLVRRGGELSLSPATRARRDELELSIAQLRELKGSLDENEYYSRLEGLLLELARLYQSPGDTPPAPK